MVVAGVIGKLSEGAVFLLLFLFPRQVPRGTLPPRPEPGTSSELPGDAEVGWRAQEEQGWECWGARAAWDSWETQAGKWNVLWWGKGESSSHLRKPRGQLYKLASMVTWDEKGGGASMHPASAK